MKKIVKHMFYFLYYIYVSVKIPIVFKYANKFGKLKHLSKNECKAWEKGFLKMMQEHCRSCFGFGSRLVYETFINADIEVVRQSPIEKKDTPVVVLSVKSDIHRLKMLVEHYRKLGVVKFAFIDNGSTDGTYEWMMEQSDIDLFKTNDKYNSLVKEGWLNRVVSYYGFGNWFILTDSDELFTYIGMEEHPIDELIRYAEANGIKRFKGINIDMYADAPIFSMESDKIDIKETYCYMDTDSYIEQKRNIAGVEITAIIGGPRLRKLNVPISMMKYPLVYFSEGTISANAHYQYPYRLIEKSPLCVGILHYKFLDSDKKEFERRANFSSGIAAGNSRSSGYYKQYIDGAEKQMTFMYEGSVRFDSSKDLERIELIQKIKF